MAVTTNDLREKTTPANGANPGAVEDAQKHAVAQGQAVNATTGKTRRVADWTPITNAEVMTQAAMRKLTIKADVEIPFGGKMIKAPAGSVVHPLRKNPDNTQWMCMIWAEGFTLGVQYPVNVTDISFPSGNTPSASRQRAAFLHDELSRKCQELVTLIGKMPGGVGTKTKTAEEWQKEFPNCTLANVVAAFQAISAFRTHRWALVEKLLEAEMTDASTQQLVMLAVKAANGQREARTWALVNAAVKANRADELKAAIEEYSRAKSWEQDVNSTAKNCGTI